MELDGIAEHLRDKSILITGSTGFLGKIFVEKVLRVQPNVKQLFLLVRATETATAAQRVQREVIESVLFSVLRQEHGEEFHSFISNKVSPLSGDIVLENLGIEENLREALCKQINAVVNVAATTSFYERYDVALNINVMGAKNIVEFAKKCMNLNMLLHVSTAYVVGKKEGLITEKAFHLGETLKPGLVLDIAAELRLAEETKRGLRANQSMKNVERKAMKDLGLTRAKSFGWQNTYAFTKAMGEMMIGNLKGDLPLVILRPTIITSIHKEPVPGWIEGTRTIDSFIIGYAEGKLPCVLADSRLVLDAIPGDMVVNAMIFAMVAHSNQRSEFIYNVGSSASNPVRYSTLVQCIHHYFKKNPRSGRNGKTMKTRKIPQFKDIIIFRGYMILRYRLPLRIFWLVNIASGKKFSRRYDELIRKYKFTMFLTKLYEPYIFFKGCFDDSKLEKLRMEMGKESNAAKLLDFDPKNIDWEDYFSNVHIPGVLKYANK